MWPLRRSTAEHGSTWRLALLALQVVACGRHEGPHGMPFQKATHARAARLPPAQSDGRQDPHSSSALALPLAHPVPPCRFAGLGFASSWISNPTHPASSDFRFHIVLARSSGCRMRNAQRYDQEPPPPFMAAQCCLSDACCQSRESQHLSLPASPSLCMFAVSGRAPRVFHSRPWETLPFTPSSTRRAFSRAAPFQRAEKAYPRTYPRIRVPGCPLSLCEGGDKQGVIHVVHALERGHGRRGSSPRPSVRKGISKV